MLHICRAFCLDLRTVNKNVTGCQFDFPNGGVISDSVDDLIKGPRYKDCLFFKGEDIVYPHKIPVDEIDRTFDCLVLEKAEGPRYTQIHPVDRKTGTVAGTKISWVLIR